MNTIFFDTFCNRYIITGQLEALSAIHIGAPENINDFSSVDSQVVKDQSGRPFIPGSSLKGVWRSFTEQVLRAIYGEEKVCCITTEPCLSNDMMNELKERYKGNKRELACELVKNLCPVCQLFGCGHFAGKIKIADLMVQEISWQGYYDLRNGVGIDRDSLTAANNVLYDFEAVPAGTLFNINLVMENVTDIELKHALYGLFAMVRGELSIGGMTTRGLGRVELKKIEVRKISVKNLSDFLLTNDIKDLPSLTLEALMGSLTSGGDVNV